MSSIPGLAGGKQEGDVVSPRTMTDSGVGLRPDARAPAAIREVERQTKPAWGFRVYSFLLIVTLAVGWLFRGDLRIEPGSGMGYWLGIAGVSCVGVLLIYPIRKRLPVLSAIGSVPFWFQLHMSLGLIAPVLILFHSRFVVNSMNAAVALTTMLIVAGSGIVGRVLYVRIHQGMHGNKSEARVMVAEAARLRQTLIRDFKDVADEAETLEREVLVRQTNVFGAVTHAAIVSAKVSAAEGRMVRAVTRGAKLVASLGAGASSNARALKRQSLVLVREYCRTLKRAAYLEAFERLFSLWHVVHLPLFFLMLVAAVIHVVAVHLY